MLKELGEKCLEFTIILTTKIMKLISNVGVPNNLFHYGAHESSFLFWLF